MDLLRILDSTPEPPIVDLHIDTVNDSGEYTLACPIYEFQKELTDQIVSLHYSDILKYCETNDKTELIVKSSQICIENCMLVNSHPYLLITHYMPKNLLQKDMAVKLAETSGKFNVLKDLVNVMTEVNKNIILSSYNTTASSTSASTSKIMKTFPPKYEKKIGIVLTNNVKLFDLVEALLIGTTSNSIKIKKYVGNYLRRDHKKHEPSNAIISVHLIPDDGKINAKEDISSLKFDLIIKFDEQVNNEFIESIRLQNRDTKSCLIKLIPLFTIEHCKLFYEGQEHEPHHLYKLISSIVCLRDQIGILPPDIFPIYNQGLNYLSTFFDQLFKNSAISNTNYPIWPLPELPPIPKFSAIDVEKSLLTEVNYHYTPYDTSDSNNTNANSNNNKHKYKTGKNLGSSYYDNNRLQSNYITNSLTNNFDKLIGIFNHNLQTGLNPTYLTHKLMVEMNNTYTEYDLVKNELLGYENFNTEEHQQRVGRRELELKKTLSTIIDDVNHSNQRIEIGNKQFDKKTEEIDTLNKDIETLLKDIETCIQPEQDVKAVDMFGPSYVDNFKQAVDNQNKIWELQDQIKEYIVKISNRQEDKSYIKSETKRANANLEKYALKVKELRSLNDNYDERYQNYKALDFSEFKRLKTERMVILKKIEDAKLLNAQLKTKLNKSFRFLKESSHLKKRKGRGITPK